MKKVIYIMFSVVFVLMICGCTNSSGYEVQNIEMLNEVMNNQYVNYTCRCTSQVTTVNENKEIIQKVEFKTYVDEGKAYITKTTEDYKIDFYEEVVDDQLCVYNSANDGSWVGPIIVKESVKQSGLLNFGEVTAEMFEYIEGVWVGNTEEIEKVLKNHIKDYLNRTLEENVEIYDFALKKFDIEISDEKLKRQVIEIEYTSMINGVEYKVFSKYIYNYSKIGSTVVDIPENLDNK